MAYFAFMAFITGFNLIPGFSWRLNNISAFHSEKTFILKIRELRWKDRSPPTLSGMSQIFVAQPGAPPRFANILFSCSFLQDNVLFAFPWPSFPISSGTGSSLRQYSRWFSHFHEFPRSRTRANSPRQSLHDGICFCFWQFPKSSNNPILSGCSISNGITRIWGLPWFSYAKLFRGQLLKKIFWGFYCASRHS